MSKVDIYSCVFNCKGHGSWFYRFLVNGAPCTLIAKTKSNQSQEWEATLLEVLHACLMSRYRWEGR